MKVADVQTYCAGKPGAWPDNPWDHEFPVFKVGEGERGKIFVALGRNTVSLKAGRTRDVADEWLARYPDDASVMAYIGRSGWNDLVFGGAIADDEILEAIDESYRLVVSGLPRRARPAGWDAQPSSP